MKKIVIFTIVTAALGAVFLLTPVSANQSNGYIELPLKMELSGNFKSYYSFLLELEQLDRITKVRELNIQKSKDGQGQVEASFVVSIFFQGA